MAESMSQIQCSSHPRLQFIGLNHLSLILTRTTDSISCCLRIPPQQLIHILLLPFKEGCITNKTILYHLTDTTFQFTIGECVKCVGIDEDTLGLVECPNHIFTEGVVD